LGSISLVQYACFAFKYFIGANKDCTDPTSLHFLNPDEKNSYQKVIAAVCGILQNYDTANSFAVYGFGGKPLLFQSSEESVSQCFPLNWDKEHPEVSGYEGICGIYSTAIPNIQFGKPRCFSPLLKEAIKAANILKDKTDQYLVLLIIHSNKTLFSYYRAEIRWRQ